MSQIYGIKRRLLFHNIWKINTIKRAGESTNKSLISLYLRKLLIDVFRLFIPYTRPQLEVANRVL